MRFAVLYSEIKDAATSYIKYTKVFTMQYF